MGRKERGRNGRRWGWALLVAFVALIGLGAASFWWLWLRPLPMAAATMEVEVPRGASVLEAGRALARQGVGVDPRALYLLARLQAGGAIFAGYYRLERGLTAPQLLDLLRRGERIRESVAFVEGWTFAQMRAALERHPWVEKTLAGADERALLAAIGASEARAEGLFFPDTYVFDRKTPDRELYRLAYRKMKEELEAAWQARDPELPLSSPYEALILASLVEKETGRAEDRGKVASVFVNRLRRGMPLQTDPTVIYGLGEEFDGNLTRRHLGEDHPWNTYTRGGLPPTPICLPGRESLWAAVRPEKTDYFYFVARGDGSSEFSRTLEEHNRAVARWQKGRKSP
ncbi:MAG: hypothetical protein PWQ19_896 [Tepidiphilus sp.]|nr:hypothetical protein [Tepidiphilus sp.]